MMKKPILLFFLILGLMCPVMLCAQDQPATDVDAYVTELNDQCPISYRDGWGIGSFTMVGDRYALVDVLLPGNLSMFLSSLGADKDNVRQLWIRQLRDYGEPWNRFVDLMVEADRRIIINLRPKDSEKTALITFSPSDFNRGS